MAERSGRGYSPALERWRKSEAWKRIASAHALAFVRGWAKLPRCGAKTKRTGCPCQNPAMANGRCRLHGGKTPSGENWHHPVFSPGTTPSGTSKLDRKLYDLAQARKRRAKVLTAMTAEQRAAYEKWHQARDPRLSVRLRRRQAKKQALEAQDLFLSLASSPPEIMQIEESIRMLQLEADRLAMMAAAHEACQGAEALSGKIEFEPPSDGIFG